MIVSVLGWVGAVGEGAARSWVSGTGLAVERDRSATPLRQTRGLMACAYGSTTRSPLVSRATAADNSRGVLSAPN